ncbi:MAG: hypothetical protein JO235_23850 [Chroococcidiopsidaceae cyanobacterium CP_BM_RX_35]|nr:hypothetical protein [Chroococcidiopsidaceae cyanobacterium CP_BM_RX_35]
MQLNNSLFLKKILSLLSAVGLAVFGGVTVTPARTQDNYHHHNYDQAEELHQVQEYRRVQKLRRLQVLRRVQDYHRVQEFQQSPEAYLNCSI